MNPRPYESKGTEAKVCRAGQASATYAKAKWQKPHAHKTSMGHPQRPNSRVWPPASSLCRIGRRLRQTQFASIPPFATAAKDGAPAKTLTRASYGGMNRRPYIRTKAHRLKPVPQAARREPGCGIPARTMPATAPTTCKYPARCQREFATEKRLLQRSPRCVPSFGVQTIPRRR